MKTKNKLAKFGVFQISETGADSLYASRNIETGQPLQTYAEAVEMKESFMARSEGIRNNLNLVVRSLKASS